MLTSQTIRSAHARIKPYIHRTPVFSCKNLDDITGGKLFFKCENFQKVGAFKMRGAANAVLQLTPEELERGVATHSSGNHAQALALAAKDNGAKAYIVMPENSPQVKVNAVMGYGAEVILCTSTLEARESTLAEVMQRTGAVFIPPFNDERIIAGQATAALELIEDVPNLDMIIAPVGGGGLLSGTALSAHYFSPGTKVIGAEPAGADDAFKSFYSGTRVTAHTPKTLADGLQTTLGDIPFAIIQEWVSGIAICSEATIVTAMKLTWERMKIIIEPSSAVPLGAILDGNIDVKGKRVGIIISGGNVDLDKRPWIKS